MDHADIDHTGLTGVGGAALSSATPLVESGAGGAGAGTAASKDDHVHPAAAGGGLLQAFVVKLTSGDLTTVSTTFVDATGLTVTLTTGAHRCLVIFAGTVFLNTNAQNIAVDLNIDGSRVGGTYGLVHNYQNGAGALNVNAGFSFLTDVLSAASHTIKLQFRVDSGTGGTGKIYASSVDPAIFQVIETGLTT